MRVINSSGGFASGTCFLFLGRLGTYSWIGSSGKKRRGSVAAAPGADRQRSKIQRGVPAPIASTKIESEKSSRKGESGNKSRGLLTRRASVDHGLESSIIHDSEEDEANEVAVGISSDDVAIGVLGDNVAIWQGDDDGRVSGIIGCIASHI